MYASLLVKAKRLLESNAIDKRGRPPADADQAQFYRESRAFKMALKSMPSEFQREWNAYIDSDPVYKSIRLDSRIEHAQARAYTRGERRLNASGADIADQSAKLSDIRRMAVIPAHEAHQIARQARLAAVDRAMAALESAGIKVGTKTVARELERQSGQPCEVKLDTLRKYISEIRHARHKE